MAEGGMRETGIGDVAAGVTHEVGTAGVYMKQALQGYA